MNYSDLNLNENVKSHEINDKMVHLDDACQFFPCTKQMPRKRIEIDQITVQNHIDKEF